MKEINEKTIARARRSIVSLGIVRGVLYLITAALTWLYAFGVLNGMESVAGLGATVPSRWLINIYYKLAGTQFSLRGAFTNLDMEFLTKLDTFALNMETAISTNWFSIFVLPTIALLLVICFVLYLRARSLRIAVAASERD